MDSTRVIPLRDGYFFVVDECDYEKVSRHTWHLHSDRNGYLSVKTNIRTDSDKRSYRTVSISRFLAGEPEGMEVDHADGNTLNNSKSNLRICTKSQNQRNRRPQSGSTSIYKGVSFQKSTLHKKKWVAAIRINGKSKTIGRFSTEIEAATAYDEMARVHHGAFAKLNFPNSAERVA